MKKLKNDGGGNLGLILDTQVLVWIGIGGNRLSKAARSAINDTENECWISSVTAWEFVDLNRRGRFGADLDLVDFVAEAGFQIVGFPAAAWTLAYTLPQLHLDPVDRMLIAHAIHDDLTLITADKIMRDYPVKTLW